MGINTRKVVTTLLVGLLVGTMSFIATTSVAASTDATTPPVGTPAVHGDTPPLSVLPVDAFPYDPADYAAVAVLRERSDGSAVPALLILHEQGRGVTEQAMVEAGLPVIPMEEIEQMSLDELATVAEPAPAILHAIDDLAIGAPPGHSHGGDGIGIQTHPTSPISDSTSIPVTTYADSNLQAQSGWSSDLTSSFNAAKNTLASQAGVNVYHFYLMTTGTPVSDVSTYCHMDQTASYEAGFAPHKAVAIMVFSTGDVEGSWGVALDDPVSSQIQDDWSWDYCSSSWRTPRWIPSVYVRHLPLLSLGNMQMTATHELAHQFTMRHEDASCWSIPGHLHKTIEAFTSGSGTPASCGSNVNPFQHWHWDFTTPTDTRMWNERVKWTGCYNSGC